MFTRQRLIDLAKTYGLGISLALIVAVSFRSLFLEAFKIPTSVMQPTLEPGDIVFVRKTKDVTYGDVITFEAVNDGKTLTYVKRVVGMPGDRMRIVNGKLEWNGVVLPFKPSENAVCGDELHPKGTYRVCLEPPLLPNLDYTTVNNGELFVIGDARSTGLSRLDHALISKNQVTGRVKWVWLSLDPLESSSRLPRFRFQRMFRAVR